MEAVVALLVLLFGFSVTGQDAEEEVVMEEEMVMEETMQEQEMVVEEETMEKL